MICKRCRRRCEPWPLSRSARCAPKDWAMCISPTEDCEPIASQEAFDAFAKVGA